MPSPRTESARDAADAPRTQRLIPHLAALLAGFLVTAVGATAVADRTGLSLLAGAGDDERAALLLAYAREAGSEDVLLVGSSRMQAGVMAMVAEPQLEDALGHPVSLYQLGLAGLRPTLLANLLETITVRRPPRELLVVAIENRFFAQPRDTEGEWNADRVGRPGEAFFRGLEAWPDARILLDGDVNERAEIVRERRGDRFTPAGVRKRSLLAAEARSEGLELFDLDGAEWVWSEAEHPDQVNWLRCLDLIEQLPCEVLFVKMPLLRGFERQHMGDMTVRFRRDVLPELARRKLEFQDLNGPLWPNRAEYFYGWTHLNYEGAVRTTARLVQTLLAPRLAAE